MANSYRFVTRADLLDDVGAFKEEFGVLDVDEGVWVVAVRWSVKIAAHAQQCPRVRVLNVMICL